MTLRYQAPEARPSIAVVGGGYVGLATATGFAHLGHRVTLLERDPERRSLLAQGQAPFCEPSLEEPFAQLSIPVVGPEEFPSDTDIAFICVGTPPAPDGSLDLSALRTAVEHVARSTTAAIVIRSTVLPGTTRKLTDDLRAAGVEARCVFNPEFLREGSAFTDFQAPDRVVIGSDHLEVTEALEALYRFADAPLIITNPETAELIKIGANSMLATRLAVANEVASIALAVGADPQDVLAAIGADQRIGGAYLVPGLGFGGSCLPKDLDALRHLAQAAGIPAAALHAAARTNDAAIDRVVNALTSIVDTDTTVTIMGLGFKYGSDSVRGSRAIVLIERLLALGFTVRAYDPLAVANARAALGDCITYLESSAEAFDNAGVLIFTQPHYRLELPVPSGITSIDELGRIDPGD